MFLFWALVTTFIYWEVRVFVALEMFTGSRLFVFMRLIELSVLSDSKVSLSPV